MRVPEGARGREGGAWGRRGRPDLQFRVERSLWPPPRGMPLSFFMSVVRGQQEMLPRASSSSRPTLTLPQAGSSGTFGWKLTVAGGRG